MAKVTTTKPQIAGQEIRDAREELGLTQQQLADLLGVAGLSVSRWELGASFPDAPGAVRMALEYLKIQRVLDNSELLRTLDERGAEIEAMRERLLAESTKETLMEMTHDLRPTLPPRR
jgi:transcriptional regulator with XRE-family HTH domain